MESAMQDSITGSGSTTDAPAAYTPTDRTVPTRSPDRASYDRELAHPIPDEPYACPPGSARPPAAPAASPPPARPVPTRSPDRASYDRELVHSILDESYVCHLGFVRDGAPVVLPTLYGRIGDRLYVHGSTGSRPLRAA